MAELNMKLFTTFGKIQLTNDIYFSLLTRCILTKI